MGDLNVTIGSQRLGIKKEQTGSKLLIAVGEQKHGQTSAGLPNLDIRNTEIFTNLCGKPETQNQVRDYTILNEEMQKQLKTFVTTDVQI
jgi:hypothetical protein